MEGVKVLFAWASPFAMRVEGALKLKGIEYEKLEQDLGNKSQLLLQSNPVYKKIPVLIHNGKPVCESAIILQYIDEVWPHPAPLFPKDPYARAQIKFWGDFVDSKLFKGIGPLARSSKALPEANKDFAEACALLEQQLSEAGHGPFMGGKEVNYADVMLFPFARWIPAMVSEFGLEMPAAEECPKVHELFAALREHSVLKTALPDEDKLKCFIQARFGSTR